MTSAQPSEFGAKPLCLLALILALAAVLRFHNIDKDGMWLDEMLTVENTTGHGFSQMLFPAGEVIEHPPDYTTMANAAPWYRIFPESHYDSHPPLIHLLLRLWRDIVPDTDGWMRGFIVLQSLVAIAMLYFAVAAQAGPTPALWASLIMTLAAVQVEYAQECRSYMLLLICLFGACIAMLRIEKFGFTLNRGLWLGVSSFCAMMTHYLALPQLCVVAMYILICFRGRDRMRSMMSLAAAGFFYCIVWGPFAPGQRGLLRKNDFTKPDQWSIRLWLTTLAGLPAEFLSYARAPLEFLSWLGLFWVVAPLALMRRNKTLLFWWLWLVFGAASVAFSDLMRESLTMHYPRYTLAISPAMYALTPLLFWNLSGFRRHLLPAAVALICAIALPGAKFHNREDWRPIDQFIAAHLGPDDIRIMYDTRGEFLDWRTRCDLEWMMYYDHEPRGAVVFLQEPPSPQVEARIRAARTAWFFAPESIGNVQSVIPGAKVLLTNEYPKVGTLQQIELPPPATMPSTSRGN